MLTFKIVAIIALLLMAGIIILGSFLTIRTRCKKENISEGKKKIIKGNLIEFMIECAALTIVEIIGVCLENGSIFTNINAQRVFWFTIGVLLLTTILIFFEFKEVYYDIATSSEWTDNTYKAMADKTRNINCFVYILAEVAMFYMIGVMV